MNAKFDSSSHASLRSMIAALALGLPLVAMAQDTISPEAKPVKDNSRASGNDSRPATGDANPPDTNARPVGKDVAPVKGAEKEAGQDARPLEGSQERAGKDARESKDTTPEKASPAAQPAKDSSMRAGPDSRALRDGNDDQANPASREIPARVRAKNAADDPSFFGAQATEAQIAYQTAFTEMANDVRERKARVQGADQARLLMESILGKSSSVSIAELELEREREAVRGASEDIEEATPGARQTAAEAMSRRLAGRVEEGEVEKTAAAGVHFMPYASRAEVPAVLVASAAMGQGQLQTGQDAAGVLGGSIPENYKGEDARVMTYRVDERSMLEIPEVSFEEGSTRFAEVEADRAIDILAIALGNSALSGASFVIEVHGPVDSLDLSQMQAEALARKLVRIGVSSQRLLPVGYAKGVVPAEGDATEETPSRVVIYRLVK